MKHAKITLIALASAVLMLLSACGQTAAPAPSESPANTAPAALLADFTAADLDGNTIDETTIADYKLTMVNVWATFCGPCLREMPDLGELAAEYAEKDVLIIGLVSDTLASDGSIAENMTDLARDIVAETGAAYPHMLPSADLLGILSQIRFVPTTFFVDAEGNQVGSAYVSAKSKAQWASIIDEMLQEVE